MPKVIIICVSPPPSASSFQDIVHSDKADRGCFINTGRVSILSESPSKQDSTTSLKRGKYRKKILFRPQMELGRDRKQQHCLMTDSKSGRCRPRSGKARTRRTYQ